MRFLYLALTMQFAVFVQDSLAEHEVASNNSALIGPVPQKPISDFDELGPFKIEAELKKRVQFWIDVYAKYSRWDMVLHDAKYPHIIFDVVKTRPVREHGHWNMAKRSAELSNLVAEKKHRVYEALLNIDRKEKDIVTGVYAPSAFEKKIYDQYADIKEDGKFAEAARGNRRIRGQFGLKESFVDGLYESGRYLSSMKQIVAKFGMPTEIVYLPFLESGYDQRALSKVGASGLWQFIPSTGKFFLRIDDTVDERNDPMKAAEAAALLMKDNFAALGEWPLAITAYNHGRAGLQKAVKTLQTTSLAKIIANYQGSSFGFASANFYSSFMAALHVAKNAEYYFGNVDRAGSLVFDEFVMPEYMEVATLSKFVGIEVDVFREYNPGLTAAVYSGKKYIPVGYILRIPYERREDFLIRYKSIPQQYRYAKQKTDEGKRSGLASVAENEEKISTSGTVVPIKQQERGASIDVATPTSEDHL